MTLARSFLLGCLLGLLFGATARGGTATPAHLARARAAKGQWVDYHHEGDRTKSLRFVNGELEAKLVHASGTRVLTVLKSFDATGAFKMQSRSDRDDGMTKSSFRGRAYSARELSTDAYTVKVATFNGMPGPITLAQRFGYHRFSGTGDPLPYHVMLQPAGRSYTLTLNNEAFVLSTFVIPVPKKLLVPFPPGARQQVETWLAANGALAD